MSEASYPALGLLVVLAWVAGMWGMDWVTRTWDKAIGRKPRKP